MHTIIIGCGRMGSGLAQSLALRGHTGAVLDRDPEAFARLGPTFAGRTIVGHAFDRDALEAAGIRQADALAAVTASDDVNAIVARAARLFYRVPRVVARLYDPRKAEIYRHLGIQTISTTTWGIYRIAELISYSDLEPIVSLGAQVDIVDLHVPAGMVGRQIATLSIPGEVQVVAVSRGGTTFLPTARSVFQEGDLAHLALVASSADRLQALIGA
jgi:trk system potassium uptake protein TrkA